MKIGFIGYGEASYHISKGLNSENAFKFFAYDPQYFSDNNNLIKQRAEKEEVEMLSMENFLTQDLEIIFSAVPSNNAISVCKQLKSKINKKFIYIDVTASTPETQMQIQKELKDTNILFVDGAMLGPLSKFGHRVPIIVSGKGSRIFKNKMDLYNMNIEIVGDNAGEASSIKLIRSIFMKGIASLAIETLSLAEEMDVSKQVMKSLAETFEDKSFENSLNQIITGTAIHAKRRSYELNGSLELLNKLKINSIMTDGAISKLEYIDKLNLRDKFNEKRPDYWQSVIQEIKIQTNEGD